MTLYITGHARNRMEERGVTEEELLALPSTIHFREGQRYLTDGKGLVARLNEQGDVITVFRCDGTAPPGAWVLATHGNTGQTKHHHPARWWPAATGHRLIRTTSTTTSLSSISWLVYAAPEAPEIPKEWGEAWDLSYVDPDGIERTMPVIHRYGLRPDIHSETVVKRHRTRQRRTKQYLHPDGSIRTFAVT